MASDSADVDLGDELVLEIEDIGNEGDGIAYTDSGFVVVVPDATMGERVRVRIDRVGDDQAIADVIDEESDVAS